MRLDFDKMPTHKDLMNPLISALKEPGGSGEDLLNIWSPNELLVIFVI